MDQINEAIAAIESREPGDDLVYQEYADWFGVDRCTLARRHQGRQGTRQAKIFDQKKLTPAQEEELILYIRDLTRRGLPPTNTMIRNFASTIAHERVSESWVTRSLRSTVGFPDTEQAFFGAQSTERVRCPERRMTNLTVHPT
ncbi:hypothetical protein EJ07DRAFT_134968 [Lizonia empirigonia]|nr:hypothetical protein EJ07DRAFT_134968 [Lizonia empirigonia]